MSEVPFGIETSVEGDTHSVAVHGELDSGTSPLLSAAIEAAIERGARALRLDLTRLTFIDSAGMRAMILIERAVRDRQVPLTVLAPPEELTELLDRAGLGERLAFVRTAAEPDDRVHLERVELELSRLPVAPGQARALVRELLAQRLTDAELTTAILLASELVTNAVVHPAADDRPILLRITLYDDGVRVEVGDSGDGFDPERLPPARAADAPVHGGRGLFLVDRCATRWGVERAPATQGKPFVVWFELDEQLTA